MLVFNRGYHLAPSLAAAAKIGFVILLPQGFATLTGKSGVGELFSCRNAAVEVVKG
jgi:hypothetical protein